MKLPLKRPIRLEEFEVIEVWNKWRDWLGAADARAGNNAGYFLTLLRQRYHRKETTGQ